ncbi:leucine-rich repeat-containing protein 16 [Microdochium nivale]|nr:leucine-rich repeat-containing protein 16 [Microdochium nivale]
MDAIEPARKAQRRLSFRPGKALRSLSISSTISSSSETELAPSPQKRRNTLRKSLPTDYIKDLLERQPSQNSTVSAHVDRSSNSTVLTTPSPKSSTTTSLLGDNTGVLRAGPLQPEASILKAKKEYIVLTAFALLKYKSHQAALDHFPNLGPNANADTSTISHIRDPRTAAESCVPLEHIVSVFKDEGTRPSFGLEVWWKEANTSSTFTCLELDFSQPDDRDGWLKQIRCAMKQRSKALLDEQPPTHVEFVFTQIIQAKHEELKNSHVEIYPIVPRRPYTRIRGNAGEAKKGWRDGCSFYLAFSKNQCMIAQFTKSPTGQPVNPNIVQFGLVTLSRVNAHLQDERFDLIFRLPLDKPCKLQLSSRHYRTITTKLLKADTYLKPAWPFWTRREIFIIEGDSQQIHVPEGDDYGGFRRTLEAFIEGYHCAPVNWTVVWKDVRHAPEFRLLPPTKAPQYSAHQLLAVFRALRFNDYFKSLSFSKIDLSPLAAQYDNASRYESTVWVSRTGKRSLTPGEYELSETASVLFQELIALLLGSESVRHIDLDGALNKKWTQSVTAQQPDETRSCEILPPIVLLWKSCQTRCNSVNISGNPLGIPDVAGLSRNLQNRPDFLRSFSCARCDLDESALKLLWEGLSEHASSLEGLDVSNNPGRLEAQSVARLLNNTRRLKRINLANAMKGDLDGPLIKPWDAATSEPWKLEEINISGWKMNFDTVTAISRFLELDTMHSLRVLDLSNCGLTGDMATTILCRVVGNHNLRVLLNGNPLEAGTTDWIDLIQGNEAPKRLHLDMIQFQQERNFHRLLKALTHNKTIEFLSMVGTGPPSRAGSRTSELLFKFLEQNDTIEYLDISGYSGKLEDGHLGWGMSGALGGLKDNTSLRQLRMRNHDIGAAEDITDLCRVLATNKSLAMVDCQNNNFSREQFGKIAVALAQNRQIISFPLSNADREYAIHEEKASFVKSCGKLGKNIVLSKSNEARLASLVAAVRTAWETEANRIILAVHNNRDDPVNWPLDIEPDHIDRWEDATLPLWIESKGGIGEVVRGKDVYGAKDKNHPRLSSNLGATLADWLPPVTGTLFDNYTAESFMSSEPVLGTYTITEESATSSKYSSTNSLALGFTPAPPDGGDRYALLANRSPLAGPA